MIRFKSIVCMALLLGLCVSGCSNGEPDHALADSARKANEELHKAQADTTNAIEEQPPMPIGVAIRNSTDQNVTFYISYNGSSADESYTTSPGYPRDYPVRANRVFMIIPANQGASSNSSAYKTILQKGGYYHIIQTGNGFSVTEE